MRAADQFDRSVTWTDAAETAAHMQPDVIDVPRSYESSALLCGLINHVVLSSGPLARIVRIELHSGPANIISKETGKPFHGDLSFWWSG